MVLRGRGGGGQSPACPDPSQQGQWRCGSSPGASIYTSQGQGGGARGKSEWQPWSPRTRGPGPDPGRRLDGKLPTAIWKTLDIFQASGRRRKQGEQSPESQPASSAVLPGPRPLVWTSGSEWLRGEGSASTTWMVRAGSEAPAHASLGCTVTNFTLGQDSQPQCYQHWRQCRLGGGGRCAAVLCG